MIVLELIVTAVICGLVLWALFVAIGYVSLLFSIGENAGKEIMIAFSAFVAFCVVVYFVHGFLWAG